MFGFMQVCSPLLSLANCIWSWSVIDNLKKYMGEDRVSDQGLTVIPIGCLRKYYTIDM